MPTQISLTSEMVQAIEKALAKGKTVEIAIRGGNIVIWENSSKKIV